MTPIRSCLAVALCAALGCAPEGGPPPRPSRDAGSEAPLVAGVITRATPAAILVEANPREEAGSPKAMLDLDAATHVVHAGGGAARASDLRTGMRVRVWARGAVRETYPLRGTADRVVIEP